MYDRLISALRKAYEYSMEWKRNPFRYAALYKKAADVIEELQKPKWIPVTERLPEPNDRVLTFARFLSDGSWWMEITSWTGVTNHDIPKFWGYGDGMVVTHWMPLPEAPEEET